MAAPAEEKVQEKDETVIFVTGANKGIGLELCKMLVKHDDIRVLLGCRNHAYVPKPKNPKDKKDPANYEAVGKDAVNLNRLQILEARFKDMKNIEFREIDITDKESCDANAQYIKDTIGGIDILVNNAGMAFKGNAFDINVVNTTLNTNHYGTINATTALLPFVKDGGRVIMTSSRAGLLQSNIKDDKIRKTLLDSKLTLDGVENILTDFRTRVAKDKSLKGAPYKQSAYGMSKVAMSAYSRILAQSVLKRGIFVAAYCPGWCQTYMSSGSGKRSAANGAKGLELLCTEDLDVKQTGKFWGVEFADNTNDNATGKLVNYDWTTGAIQK